MSDNLPAKVDPTLPARPARGNAGQSLTPLERRLAEAYTLATTRNWEVTHKKHAAFHRFIQTFNRNHAANKDFEPVTEESLCELRQLRAFTEYVRVMRQIPAARALEQLDAEADEAVQTYFEARDMARREKDYKAMHVTASDHLDRIGATRKKEQPASVAAVQIVLRSKNYTAENLLADSPEIVVEGE